MNIKIKSKPKSRKKNPYGEPANMEEPRVLDISPKKESESPKPTSQLSINLTPQEHRDFKIYAVTCNKSMKDIFLEAIDLHKKYNNK